LLEREIGGYGCLLDVWIGQFQEHGPRLHHRAALEKFPLDPPFDVGGSPPRCIIIRHEFADAVEFA
jgi:hypothetical protein